MLLKTTILAAFPGHELIIRGALKQVIVRCKSRLDGAEEKRLSVFEDETGRVIDIDVSGTQADVQTLADERAGRRSSILHHGGDGDLALLICGGDQFEPHPLVDLLPDMLFVKSSDGAIQEWGELTLRLMAGEATTPGPGSETVMTRLADILVVGAV